MQDQDRDEQDLNKTLAQILLRLDQDNNLNLEDLVAEYPSVKEELESYFSIARQLDGLFLKSKDMPQQGIQANLLKVEGFRVLKVIGRGGMSVVYEAFQERLNRRVALKVLPSNVLSDRDRLERFQLEATLAARIHDSHIVPVYDVVLADENPVLVMPLIDGADLEKIISQRNLLKSEKSTADIVHPWVKLEDRLFADKILNVFDQIFRAISSIHQHGIIHRDIKPSNILIDENGNSWLSDFGLARLGMGQDLTKEGTVLGTPGFISPEQLRGDSDVDQRTDVFSAGITAYRALTLEFPYSTAFIDLDSRLPRRPSLTNRHLTDSIDTVILKAVSPKKLERYSGGGTLYADWDRARSGNPISGRLPNRTRKTLARAVGVILLVIMIACIPFLMSRGTDDEPEQRRQQDNLRPPANSKSITDGPVENIALANWKIRIPTAPSAHRGVMVWIDPKTRTPDETNKFILTKVGNRLEASNVPPGEYLVVAQVDRFGFHEVYRTVPERSQADWVSSSGLPKPYRHKRWKQESESLLTLPLIEIPSKRQSISGMCFLKGGDFTAGTNAFNQPSLSPHKVLIQDFYMDVTEVSKANYAKCFDLVSDPSKLTDEPVANVTNDAAIAYAELCGKRIPTEFEYEFAATNGGKTWLPWGDDEMKLSETAFDKKSAGFDRTNTMPQIQGLYSSVAEWTDSLGLPYPTGRDAAKFRAIMQSNTHLLEMRVIRGAPFEAIKGNAQIPFAKLKKGPRWRIMRPRTDKFPGLGFRCVKSASPRFLEPGN